jgi:hypothetical protein
MTTQVLPTLAAVAPSQAFSPLPVIEQGLALVIVDGGVDDVQALCQDAASRATVVVLDPNQDGIQQITDILQTHAASGSAVSSLHLVSHGAPGSLSLGSSQLSLSTLEHYADRIQSWQMAGADLLIYGCEVAQGSLAHVFLQQLRLLTGANIAASTRRVGAPAAGGQWQLEQQFGTVRSPLIFSPALQQSYTGTFIQVNLSTSTNNARPNALVESLGNELTFTFTLDAPAPAGGLKVYVDSNLESIMNRLDLGVLAFDPTRLNNLSINPDGFVDFLNTGFAVTINPGATTATLRLPIFDNEEGDQTIFPDTFDGLDPVTFMIKTRDQIDTTNQISPYSGATGNDRQFVEGDGKQVSAYTIGTASSTVLFADTPDQLPAVTPPTFKITADKTTLIEHEGTRVTFTIDLIAGTVPAGGVVLRIGTGVDFGLGDFLVLPPDATFTGGTDRNRWFYE